MVLKNTYAFFIGLILTFSLGMAPVLPASASNNTDHITMESSTMSGSTKHMNGDIPTEADCQEHCDNIASMDQSCSSSCSQISSSPMGLQSINNFFLIQVMNIENPIVNEKAKLSIPLLVVPPPKL